MRRAVSPIGAGMRMSQLRTYRTHRCRRGGWVVGVLAVPAVQATKPCPPPPCDGPTGKLDRPSCEALADWVAEGVITKIVRSSRGPSAREVISRSSRSAFVAGSKKANGVGAELRSTGGLVREPTGTVRRRRRGHSGFSARLLRPNCQGQRVPPLRACGRRRRAVRMPSGRPLRLTNTHEIHSQVTSIAISSISAGSGTKRTSSAIPTCRSISATRSMTRERSSGLASRRSASSGWPRIPGACSG